jgi:hypothetical protein
VYAQHEAHQPQSRALARDLQGLPALGHGMVQRKTGPGRTAERVNRRRIHPELVLGHSLINNQASDPIVYSVEFSPLDKLNFTIDLSSETEQYCREKGYIDAICFGVLDVMLVGPLTPICHFDCVIKGIEYHERRSSRLAFRLAARNAVQLYLSKQRFNSLWACNRGDVTIRNNPQNSF